MADELKSEMRKLENLIGCQKVDITSRSSMEEFIGALKSKYKSDIQKSIHLHRLEFYHDLIENARQKKNKSTEVEEDFLLDQDEKDAKGDAKKETEETPVVKEDLERPDEVVSVSPENIDEYKNQMTLSKIQYVMEHPMSEGLTWKRRIRKKRHIPKFNDKDLIEWRVAQNFRLKTLEDWAKSRSDARKLAAKSPYDFDDLLDDNESRELEDMFNILDTQKSKTREVGVLEKVLHTKRPFKFKDEGMEDWTESYSDDSEYSGSEHGFFEILDIADKPEIKVGEFKESSDELSFDEGESVSGVFSSYEDIPKYKRPIFEAMEKSEDMEEWYDLCHEAIGERGDLTSEAIHSPTKIKIARPEDEMESMLEAGTLSPLGTIYEEDEEGYKAHDEDTIRRQSTKCDIELIVEKAKSEIAKERSSVELPKENDLDSVLRMESASKSRIKKVIEPESQASISEDQEREVESEIKSLESAAKSFAASDVVTEAEKPSKETELAKASKETEIPKAEAADSDSVESISKHRINKDENNKTASGGVINDDQKSEIKEEIETIILEAKVSAENLTQETSSSKESASKSRIDKNENNEVKETVPSGVFNEDKSEVKEEIQTRDSEAKVSAENHTQDNSSSLESVSKSKNEDKEVKGTASDGIINEDHESGIKEEIQTLISEAKSSVENRVQDTSTSLKKSDSTDRQDEDLDSV